MKIDTNNTNPKYWEKILEGYGLGLNQPVVGGRAIERVVGNSVIVAESNEEIEEFILTHDEDVEDFGFEEGREPSYEVED